ncbi:D-2-hydroxyglutarate dehydrogenase, mitochondrial-like [Paramacrobiotus metropolitanus]|uniref:D-2-hydroxyglutarate dehydrogenase, mitochondrial-like n=1 Tax=Paramacrobiotus metropolitanus TaxID=2943436 RepID=UPI002445A5F1|nr:D-2-hydroxyglutarate dehydrogenase, mitochondrial-like [Paramacrobiotus metropolitanus]
MIPKSFLSLNVMVSYAKHLPRTAWANRGCNPKHIRCASTFSVPFTADRYSIKRGSYEKINDQDLAKFRQILGSDNVIISDDDLERYNVDWLNICRGQSKVVLRPKDTQQVSAIMKHCNERNLAVCPQGGNTGLVGGSVPVFDEVVISMGLMNKIISLDKISGVAIAQSGTVLETLENHAMENDRIVPLDLGAKGSCHIGGNVATNAGGLRFLRYGSLHANVLGLEVVLADGTFLPFGTNMRKDNTGYHLHHLFIGSEGSLGIITQVALLCPPRPTSVSLCLLGLNSFEDVLQCYQQAGSRLTDIMSAFEFLDTQCFAVSCEEHNVPAPLKEFPFYAIIEVSGWQPEADSTRLNELLEDLMGNGLVADGIVTDEPSRMQTVWKIREGVAEASARRGYCYKYDLSIPKQQMYQLVQDMKERLGSKVIFSAGYGHLGDNNLHLNIIAANYTPEVAKAIEPFVFEWTRRKKVPFQRNTVWVSKRGTLSITVSPRQR